MTDATAPSHDRDPEDLAAALAEVEHATKRLLATVAELAAERPDGVREPSLLPGWTRGHVLTHIARNADGLVNLATWARTGEEVAMYAPGTREVDIEVGAGRPVPEHASDIEASAQRLHEALAGLSADALGRRVRFSSGAEVPARELPSARLREVEVHHVDLDFGYTPAHWSPEWSVRTLEEVAATFRERADNEQMPVGTLVGTGGGTWLLGPAGTTLTGPESGLLAWLIGRSDGDGLHYDGDGPLRAAPRWR